MEKIWENEGIWRKRWMSGFLSGPSWYFLFVRVVFVLHLNVSSQKWLRSFQPLFCKTNVRPPAACFACVTEYPNKYDGVFQLQLLQDHKFLQPASPLRASWFTLKRNTFVRTFFLVHGSHFLRGLVILRSHLINPDIRARKSKKRACL